MKEPVCQRVRFFCGPSRLYKSACKVDVDDDDDDDEEEEEEAEDDDDDDDDDDDSKSHATY